MLSWLNYYCRPTIECDIYQQSLASFPLSDSVRFIHKFLTFFPSGVIRWPLYTRLGWNHLLPSCLHLHLSWYDMNRANTFILGYIEETLQPFCPFPSSWPWKSYNVLTLIPDNGRDISQILCFLEYINQNG